MADLGTRWLAAVLAAMLGVAPVLAEPGEAPAPALETHRADIAGQMVEIGRTPQEAHNAASRLTARDLEVLLANPRMMQPAGAMTAQAEMLLGTVLIVALIVALAVAGGSVIIITSV